jgi:Skp family chaperone for outer membrane proteins
MSARICGVLALLCAGPVSAQSTVTPQPTASPFLTLNQERLYQQSDFGQRVKSTLQIEASRLSEENRRIDAALTEEEKRLTVERSSMTPDEFRTLATDFDERVTAIRKAQQSKQASIQRQGDQERARFFELAFPILLGLVEETGAVAILNDSAVIFSVRQIDITEAAIVRINQIIGASPLDPEPGQSPVQRPAVDQ